MVVSSGDLLVSSSHPWLRDVLLQFLRSPDCNTTCVCVFVCVVYIYIFAITCAAELL